MTFTAPGRIEICGNHTDHQRGCVLTAAINLYCRAEVSLKNDGKISINSQGFAPFDVDINDLELNETEIGTSKALVKGIAKRFSQFGTIPSFSANISSEVHAGSGLSSSAAFEVLIGRIINSLGNFGLGAEEIAKIAQYSENVYYGKPCGLMDQMASSCEGLLYIDFKEDNPIIERLSFDFSKYGYEVIVVDSHVDHQDLTQEYASIPEEIKNVCKYFDKKVLREIPYEEFKKKEKDLRTIYSSRAVNRCIHVYEENERVKKALWAAKNADLPMLLSIINESGESSKKLLENVIPSYGKENEGLSSVINMCKNILNGAGAVRVHGGGFAGTVLCIVPESQKDLFINEVNNALGEGSCLCLKIEG